MLNFVLSANFYILRRFIEYKESCLHPSYLKGAWDFEVFGSRYCEILQAKRNPRRMEMLHLS